MPWPRPVSSVFSASEAFIDRLLCVVGAVAFSQIPEFMQQYLQRLGGHLDEARRQLEEFRSTAAQSGLTLDQLVHATSATADPAVARLGGVIRDSQARVAVLSADEQAIRAAHLFSRPFVFLHHADPEIVRATWAIFRPAVPTTVEGLLYALTGMVFILCFYHGAVRYPIRRAYRRRAALPAALASLALALSLPARGAAPASPADASRVSFIFHFTEFVDWPSSAFARSDDPMRIGVVGNDDLAVQLRRSLRGEKMGDHVLTIGIVRTLQEARRCRLLYVAAGAERMIPLRQLKEPVLTVGETDAFVAAGGMIRFLPSGDRLQLRINDAAARAASLSVRASLLHIAQLEAGGSS